MVKFILAPTLLVIVVSSTLVESQVSKFDIIDIHDYRNDDEFYKSVDEQFTVAISRGNERLTEFYNWIKAARLEMEGKLERWPTFPKSREVLRLRMREKWLRLKEYESAARRAIQKQN